MRQRVCENADGEGREKEESEFHIPPIMIAHTQSAVSIYPWEEEGRTSL